MSLLITGIRDKKRQQQLCHNFTNIFIIVSLQLLLPLGMVKSVSTITTEQNQIENRTLKSKINLTKVDRFNSDQRSIINSNLSFGFRSDAKRKAIITSPTISSSTLSRNDSSISPCEHIKWNNISIRSIAILPPKLVLITNYDAKTSAAYSYYLDADSSFTDDHSHSDEIEQARSSSAPFLSLHDSQTLRQSLPKLADIVASSNQSLPIQLTRDDVMPYAVVRTNQFLTHAIPLEGEKDSYLMHIDLPRTPTNRSFDSQLLIASAEPFTFYAIIRTEIWFAKMAYIPMTDDDSHQVRTIDLVSRIEPTIGYGRICRNSSAAPFSIQLVIAPNGCSDPSMTIFTNWNIVQGFASKRNFFLIENEDNRASGDNGVINIFDRVNFETGKVVTVRRLSLHAFIKCSKNIPTSVSPSDTVSSSSNRNVFLTKSTRGWIIAIAFLAIFFVLPVWSVVFVSYCCSDFFASSSRQTSTSKLSIVGAPQPQGESALSDLGPGASLAQGPSDISGISCKVNNDGGGGEGTTAHTMDTLYVSQNTAKTGNDSNKFSKNLASYTSSSSSNSDKNNLIKQPNQRYNPVVVKAQQSSPMLRFKNRILDLSAHKKTLNVNCLEGTTKQTCNSRNTQATSRSAATGKAANSYIIPNIHRMPPPQISPLKCASKSSTLLSSRSYQK